MSVRFASRIAAAEELARRLTRYRHHKPPILAIPRGAVPMGHAAAQALAGELDIALVRKFRAPVNPELAVGAVDETGHEDFRQVDDAKGIALLGRHVPGNPA